MATVEYMYKSEIINDISKLPKDSSAYKTFKILQDKIEQHKEKIHSENGHISIQISNDRAFVVLTDFSKEHFSFLRGILG